MSNSMLKINSPFTILKAAFNLFRSNKEIYFPFIIVTFSYILILELAYFIPRYPLSLFFSPIIKRIWGEEFLHYPMDLLLLPKIFYYAQIVYFIFLGGYILSIISKLIEGINSSEKVSFKTAFKKSLPSYIHIFLCIAFSLMCLQILNGGYDLIIKRAYKIQSTSGIFFQIKSAVILSAGYIKFLLGLFVSFIFAYAAPIIIIEKKRFLSAMLMNFKVIFSSFWTTLVIVFIPTILFLPILILRNNTGALVEKTFPEVQIAVIILSVIASTALNAYITAVTTLFYIYKRENP